MVDLNNNNVTKKRNKNNRDPPESKAAGWRQKKWNLSTTQLLSLVMLICFCLQLFNIASSFGIDFISKQIESSMILPKQTEDLFGYLGENNNDPINRPINRTRHAIVVPYRNRSLHLSVFRKHMSDYFQTNLNGRGADFDIWIVEQDDDEPFNRGWLTNVGIAEAIKHSPDAQCIILHDVDLIPDIELGHTVPYDKCEYPTRLGNELEHFNWQVPYPKCFGGVSGISRKHWIQMNGMSNLYSGWGGEDDDLYHRVRMNELLVGERFWDKEINKGFLLTPPHGHGMFRVIDESKASHPVKRGRKPTAEKFVNQRLAMMQKDSNIWKDDGLSTLSYLLKKKPHVHHTNASPSSSSLKDDTDLVLHDMMLYTNSNNITGNFSMPEPLDVVSVMHHPVHLDSPRDLPGFASYHHIYARWDPSKDDVTRKSYDAQKVIRQPRPAPAPPRPNKGGRAQPPPPPTATKISPKILGLRDKLMQKGGYDNSPIVIEECKLLFFSIPKTGTTVFKQLFRRMMGNPNWTDDDQETIHNPTINGLKYLYDYPRSQAEHFMTSPEWTRAIFVREPKNRVLSAYMDKAFALNGWYIRTFCCGISKEMPNGPKIGLKRGCESLAPFSRNVTAEIFPFSMFVTQVMVPCNDHHWSPQSRRIGPHIWNQINFVGHFENLRDDARKMLQRIGAWEKYGASGWNGGSIFETNSVTHKTGSSDRLKEFYTPELERRIFDYYREDYEHPILNFTKPANFRGR